MRHIMSRSSTGFALALLGVIAQPAFAKPDASETQVKGADGEGKLICRREEVIGSRLKAARVCLTSQEWAQRRTEDRETLEKVQIQRYHGNE